MIIIGSSLWAMEDQRTISYSQVQNYAEQQKKIVQEKVESLKQSSCKTYGKGAAITTLGFVGSMGGGMSMLYGNSSLSFGMGMTAFWLGIIATAGGMIHCVRPCEKREILEHQNKEIEMSLKFLEEATQPPLTTTDIVYHGQ